MRQACRLILTVALFVGGTTAVSAATTATATKTEGQPLTLSKTVNSVPAPKFLRSISSQQCTINNFVACLMGSPEDPNYCPCDWVWCDDGLACGYLLY